jgi:hypothetical protein
MRYLSDSHPSETSRNLLLLFPFLQVLFDVSSDFAEGSQNFNDPLLCYSFWEKSLVTTLNIRCIPFSLKDEKKDSCFDLSEIGYKNFYPWFPLDVMIISMWFWTFFRVWRRFSKERILVLPRGCEHSNDVVSGKFCMVFHLTILDGVVAEEFIQRSHPSGLPCHGILSSI